MMWKGFALALTLLALGACSLLPNHRLDYQQAKLGDALKLPPNMLMVDNQQAYALPDQGPLLSADQYGKFEVQLPTQLPAIVAQAQAQNEEVKGPAPDINQVRSVMTHDGNGYPMIMIHTEYAWAWEYVGNALAQSGIEVSDKDREAGLYFIRLAKSHDIDERDAEIKLSHTTNGVQVVAMNKKGTSLLDKELGRVLLARLYAEL